MSHTIRKLEERHVSLEIKILRWNDRMDLLAIANCKGDVSLHRLTWQRVWCLRPDHEDVTVRDMVWRPDGKIIAVAYSDGKVILIEVENKNIVHTIDVSSSITCLDWQQDKNTTLTHDGSVNSLDKMDFGCWKYLMDIPSLATEFPSNVSSSEKHVDLNFVKNQNELNILLIGTESGNLHVSVFGLFSCAVIDVSRYMGKSCKILKSQMTDNMNILFVTVMDESGAVGIVVIDASDTSSHSKELFSLASKYVHLISLLSHLDQTMSSITEAWESILLEMDSKLSKYASNTPEGTVCADFLDLLMFGIPSDEMEEFLMQDLTDKGLKKLGHSIELSYSNIQKLLLTHMNTVGQNITLHLSELRGMARLTFRYESLGLAEQAVTDAINANGAFLVKSVEVQTVINQSMANYKAFFRWLYVVILRLMDEQIPPEIPKMTQQDLMYITEFLQNFDSISHNEKSSKTPAQKNRFNLERLGQYLVDAPLTIIPSKENNIWTTFLEENECIATHELIIKHDETMSLVQQQKLLVKSIHDIFVKPKTTISSNFSFRTFINCSKERNSSIRMSQISYNDTITLMAFIDKTNTIHFVEITSSSELNSIGQVCLFASNFHEFGGTGDSMSRILDVQFYTTSYLSVLVENCAESKGAFICQVPINGIRERISESTATVDTALFSRESPRVDLCGLAGLAVKAVEGMSVCCFAVSGTRHVSVVLSDSRHEIQLFEMEADEEEDEDETEMTFNTTQESEAMQEESLVLE